MVARLAQAIRRNARSYLLALLCLGTLVASMYAASAVQRTVANRAYTQSTDAQKMLTAMLDQETGLRGYQVSGRSAEFIVPYYRGRELFDAALVSARVNLRGDDEARALRRQTDLARRWQQSAEEALERTRLGQKLSPQSIRMRKHRMDAFRRANSAYQASIVRERDRSQSQAGTIQVLILIGLSAFFAAIAYIVVLRPAARARRRERSDQQAGRRQNELSRGLQIARSETEAHSLVKRHLERLMPGATVAVLNRNNSADKLQPVTDISDVAAGQLTERLADARPESCLAIRTASPYAQNGDETDELLTCEVCGRLAPSTSCTPSIVGGEVIGSVLTLSEHTPTAAQTRAVRDSVTQAAPVLANMRTLAIAEARAHTDALTGLSNMRALTDTAKAMGAQAVREGAPLACVAFDLDHFKSINDTYGHERGNDVLAAVGDTLRASMRSSDDFAARAGGEEFMVLLANTGRADALAFAERLRASVQALDIAGLDRSVTASFGVAVLPEDGGDVDHLMRQADRALYAAKRAGRNRVESADEHGTQTPTDLV